jgi:hypothetical protein
MQAAQNASPKNHFRMMGYQFDKDDRIIGDSGPAIPSLMVTFPRNPPCRHWHLAFKIYRPHTSN